MEPAEFIYILNSYNDYLWNFDLYVLECYRRDKIKELWEIYVAQCVSAGLKDYPKYTDILKAVKGKKVVESPEDVKQRLIDKVNKYNGGDDL